MNAIYRSACLLVVCFPLVSRADVGLDRSSGTGQRDVTDIDRL
jgi:hypothetical protein